MDSNKYRCLFLWRKVVRLLEREEIVCYVCYNLVSLVKLTLSRRIYKKKAF